MSVSSLRTYPSSAELLATASDLYKRMGPDTQGVLPDDEAYWTSLPNHLRTFIRNALPIGGVPFGALAAGTLTAIANTSNSIPANPMQALAQEFVQFTHSQGIDINNPTQMQSAESLNDPSRNYVSHMQNTDGTTCQHQPANYKRTIEQEQGYDDDFYSDEDELDSCSEEEVDVEIEYDSRSQTPGLNRLVPPDYTNSAISLLQAGVKHSQVTTGGKTGSAEIEHGEQVSSDIPSKSRTSTAQSNRAQGKQRATYIPPPPRSSIKSNGHPLPKSSVSSGGQSKANARNTRTLIPPRAPPNTAPNLRSNSISSSRPIADGAHGKSSAKRIWRNGNSEERDKIKDFWMSLHNKERLQLLSAEKEAVLKRLRDQQKHSCSCAVCGRKR